MTDKKPYWFPILCNKEYFEQLRKDYPENAEWSDEELHEYYNNSLKYQTLWDHIGDAYEDFEPLADMYLKMRDAIKGALAIKDLWLPDQGEFLSKEYAGEAQALAAMYNKLKECLEPTDL
jgi:hypothetical protein